jgi:hypothetical protein
LASSISISIAAMAFVFFVWERYKKYRNSTVRDWQRVIIYSIIEQHKEISFEELKSEYLEHAQQFQSFKIPRKEIQDDPLRRILLDLQRDHVVVRNEDLKYQVQIKLAMEAWAYGGIKQIIGEKKLMPKIIKMIEENDQKYTVDNILRRLHEINYKVSFEEIDVNVNSICGIGYGYLRKGEDGRLEYVPSYLESTNDSKQCQAHKK